MDEEFYKTYLELTDFRKHQKIIAMNVAQKKKNKHQLKMYSTNNSTTSNLDFIYPSQENTVSIYFGAAAAVVGLIGAVLNCTVIWMFLKRRNVRKKLPNLMVVNQCATDLVNCILYCPVISIVYLFTNKSWRFNGEPWMDYVSDFSIVIFFLSQHSSLLTFLFTAIERWLSIWMPMYHKVCMYVYIYDIIHLLG